MGGAVTNRKNIKLETLLKEVHLAHTNKDDLICIDRDCDNVMINIIGTVLLRVKRDSIEITNHTTHEDAIVYILSHINVSTKKELILCNTVKDDTVKLLEHITSLDMRRAGSRSVTHIISLLPNLTQLTCTSEQYSNISDEYPNIIKLTIETGIELTKLKPYLSLLTPNVTELIFTGAYITTALIESIDENYVRCDVTLIEEVPRTVEELDNVLARITKCLKQNARYVPRQIRLRFPIYNMDAIEIFVPAKRAEIARF